VVNDLTKYFGGVAALRNVSFEVEKGELSSIIGPNGAGKSTLFNALTGYVKKDGGKVVFNGENITYLEPYEICRKGIGRSFQKVNIFPGLSVFQNVQISVICGRGKGLRFIAPYSRLSNQETCAIIDSVGLMNARTFLAEELSYGDQKRLEIAIAMANKPKMLLLDEPTAGMSVEETKVMIKLIKELVDKLELAVIIVEHDMEVVFSISRKIRVLHGGKIIAEGSPDEIKKNKEVQSIYLGEEGI